jgi:hypothetical protein
VAALAVVLLCTEASAAPLSFAPAPTFATPKSAVKALVRAASASHPDALLGVLGPDARELVFSGDPVSDQAERQRFVRAAQQRQLLEPSGDQELTVVLGIDEWPFPIPLVKSKGGWRFDTEAGKQELLNRRIGRNEREAIESCLAFVDAQHEYFARDPDGNPLHHYAPRIVSSPGLRDGLYWDAGATERPSPLGELFAEAQSEGYQPAAGNPIPYHGYYYRILTAQGPHANGGAYDYHAHGVLLGGLALIAWPAEYGASGVMTFVVNHDGVVFQKDIGPKTGAVASAITTFDPDDTWQRVEVPQVARRLGSPPRQLLSARPGPSVAR